MHIDTFKWINPDRYTYTVLCRGQQLLRSLSAIYVHIFFSFFFLENPAIRRISVLVSESSFIHNYFFSDQTIIEKEYL